MVHDRASRCPPCITRIDKAPWVPGCQLDGLVLRMKCAGLMRSRLRWPVIDKLAARSKRSWPVDLKIRFGYVTIHLLPNPRSRRACHGVSGVFF
jgi:hypothetical protein